MGGAFEEELTCRVSSGPSFAQQKRVPRCKTLRDKTKQVLGRQRSCHSDTPLSAQQLEEEDLQLQAEATAQVLTEVAQAQQVLRDSVQRLEAQLQGAWLGHARQEFEALKVRGTWPWRIETLVSGWNSLPNLETWTPPSSMTSTL